MDMIYIEKKDDIILIDEFSKYLNDNYGYLTESEINELVSDLTSSSDQSLYRAMKKTYTNLFKGYNIKEKMEQIFSLILLTKTMIKIIIQL